MYTYVASYTYVDVNAKTDDDDDDDVVKTSNDNETAHFH